MNTKNVVTTICLFLSLSSLADTSLENIYNTIKYIESSNRSYITGDNGRAYGIVQIHKICVDDVNRKYGTTYTHEDAFDESCAKEIFVLYLNLGIKRYKKRYNKHPTEQNIVRMWNGGIYRGYKNKKTIKYYKKYINMKRTRQEAAIRRMEAQLKSGVKTRKGSMTDKIPLTDWDVKRITKDIERTKKNL